MTQRAVIRTRLDEAIEWAGTLLGLIGAGLLALNMPNSGYGFIAFLVSNGCWIVWSIRGRAYGMLTMQIGFTVTSITGIVRWIV